jgi:tetraacyldisaccharide 4'-kinase
LLFPLSLVFWGVVCLRKLYYAIFPFLSYKSSIQTICVGNITTGGSGKTPITLFLAEKLQDKGYRIAIILRGYKSKQEGKNIFVTSENIGFVGDEAPIYRRRFPDVPVAIGKNRVKSIKMIESMYPKTDYIILDDAFQHYRVLQDIKICVFNAQNPLGNGFMLPAGVLREPLSSVRNADFIVLNGDTEMLSSGFRERVESFGKPILEGSYKVAGLRDATGEIVDIDSLRGKKIILLSGIGSPKSFEKTIKKAGISFSAHLALPDHFVYTWDFFKFLRGSLADYEYVLTTEKDFTKLQKFNVKLSFCVVYIKFEMDTKSKGDFFVTLPK